MRRFGISSRQLFCGLAALCFLFPLAGTFGAERPPAAKLLPENTIFFVSTPDARQLEETFLRTNFGRMLQDPQLKPFFERLRSDLAKAVDSIKEQVGLSLDEMLKIYQGEIAFAYISHKEHGEPAMALLLEAGEQMPLARRLVQKGIESIEKESGMKRREETVGGVKLMYFERNGRGRPDFVFFERDNTVVLTAGLETAKDILAAWDGENKKTLSENPTFATVMSRCRGSRDETPQVIAYLDVQNLLKSMSDSMGSGRGQIFLAMMPALGLDGLTGVGGSMLMEDSRFDSVAHLHVAMENPRSGVLKVIAFKPGPIQPEYWVPPDSVKYTTFHWDIPKSLEALTKVIDGYLGEGTVNRFLTDRFQRISGVDLQQEVLSALDGRVTLVSWIQRPVTEHSSQFLIALKIKDLKKIQRAVDKVLEWLQARFSPLNYAGKTYYKNELGFPADNPIRNFCFGIVDDYLIVANHTALYEKVLLTAAEGKGALGDEPDFKLVMSKIQGLGGENGPAMVTFEREDESLRYLYELAQAKHVRKGLKREAERNPFFQSLDSALTSNPLPPFETLQKYLAPGGTVVTDDETGIHFMNFTLKRKPE
ncbi:MAG: DUF3352 domain-containing protein [Pirellulales bacterium]|nr:DUF3352 domain-containing protein [Pirellulales bacterium]